VELKPVGSGDLFALLLAVMVVLITTAVNGNHGKVSKSPLLLNEILICAGYLFPMQLELLAICIALPLEARSQMSFYGVVPIDGSCPRITPAFRKGS